MLKSIISEVLLLIFRDSELQSIGEITVHRSTPDTDCHECLHHGITVSQEVKQSPR